MNQPSTQPTAPEYLHPDIWRASQLARTTTRCIDTGFPMLSTQLGGSGWPTGTLVDLLIQQPGIGEMRLLAPALAKVAHRQVVFLQPPHPPQAISLAGLGMLPGDIVWAKSNTTADALWAAEQVLRSGSCGALLFWVNHVRSESLRRLHLAAQAGETLFFVMRPLHAVQDSSPAPLRLALRPAAGGIEIDFVKRRGPQREKPMFLPLDMYQPVRKPHQAPAPAREPVVARLDAAGLSARFEAVSSPS
jgi:protein ImuA